MLFPAVPHTAPHRLAPFATSLRGRLGRQRAADLFRRARKTERALRFVLVRRLSGESKSGEIKRQQLADSSCWESDETQKSLSGERNSLYPDWCMRRAPCGTLDARASSTSSPALHGRQLYMVESTLPTLSLPTGMPLESSASPSTSQPPAEPKLTQ